MRAWRAGGLVALAMLLPFLPSCATAPRPRPPAPVEPVAATAKLAEPTGPTWPRPKVLDLATTAYHCAEREGHFEKPILTVIDYSLPSNKRRLWVIDMQHEELLHHELVAHGEGSGDRMAVAFSNRVGSHQSSLGLFRTDEIYSGRFGYSMRLSGLEPNINDKARERAIVMHGSPDVSESTIAEWGAIGRSWGCPAVAQEVASKIIDIIADGTALFAYYPQSEWLSQSRYLNCGGPALR